MEIYTVLKKKKRKNPLYENKHFDNQNTITFFNLYFTKKELRALTPIRRFSKYRNIT